jgi:hypothetical protein
VRGEEENNLLSLVLQIAMYKFREKRGLGEVVHVTCSGPTGPASEEPRSSAKYSLFSPLAPQSLVLRSYSVPLVKVLRWKRPGQISARVVER